MLEFSVMHNAQESTIQSHLLRSNIQQKIFICFSIHVVYKYNTAVEIEMEERWTELASFAVWLGCCHASCHFPDYQTAGCAVCAKLAGKNYQQKLSRLLLVSMV